MVDIGRDPNEVTTHFIGGETKGLEIMRNYLKDKRKVNNFSKPCTAPNSIKPSTTSLSPYLKFGCLSVKLFYYSLKEVMDKNAT